ncbi:protein phosphatase 1 regulatory subunit 12A isoform X1 [Anastrepha obliqua]|uniref:protein phosphatase 1 regulatory subunit 12A isoform X1 n=1 Tax=Anastrepha obliqua TaxID=95512 RepID=UPI0024092190|nr:protein phosphatase 1 regulatory subunit 12A isoform X1 [Anastrepha obliqua]XP_054733725.1 protein phosphatase 1 regulatory subunit 12A isoform X1 [Anastrepha obliqua]XP_054733726.1 protein phosphatase 1 regulatory subunit 12A isoform X1 [Anastrepha obliqua]XP_054733727.1 protein phosphatase 1 regulatory subunit 12A isoform X1 [Anastrepha obliqua]XP_054733728.1 protein phosphatase 1 regulatory subunit 12A isoform X1 [Anastrepha obliqua]XP_054733730.1 protein phosphatase 1 regulatory subunit
MTSLDVRNNSAVMKRAEQLKRWEESDTNRQPPTPRPERGRKIKFSSGCVFLAACMSGDKEEVLKLLENGADINTANVDGLTALHQACIDDNLEMVEFLIEHGADINRQDNEGWTPLHATASCGFVSIARYLVEHNADPAAVNSDGDLAVDLAVDIQHLPMMDFMQKVMTEHNIDCEKARQAEEQLMLSDAKKWLRSDASEVDRPHPKTGATALHVAAAKGYTKVISLLLAGRANVDKQDNDGWTPLHAASHWGQKEAAEMIVNAMADMDIRNYAGQTCIDVADRKMAKFLEELRNTSNKRVKRRPSSQIRISDKIENHIDNTPTKIIRVEVKSDQSKDQANASISDIELPMIDSSEQLDQPHNLARIAEYDETDSELTDSTESSHSTSLSEPEDEKSKQPSDSSTDNQSVEEEAPWRRNSLARVRTQNESPTKNQVPEKEVNKTNNTPETSDVILRRTQSFEHDEKFYQKYHELRARIKANSCPILPATQLNSNNSSNSNSRNNNSNSSNSNSNNNINNNCNNSNNINNSKSNTNIINNPTSALGNVYTPIPNYSVQRSASLKDHRNYRTISTNTTTTSVTAAYTISAPSTADSTASVTTSTTTTTSSTAAITTPIRRSFVPPVRDEESETQRKAHAKRVRETRRSTQGVTLDEIKSAEELVKKKNSNMNNNNNSSSNETQVATAPATIPSTSQQQEIESIEPLTQPSITASQALIPLELNLQPQRNRRSVDNDETPNTPSTISAECAREKAANKEGEPEAEKDEAVVENDGEDVSASFTIVTPARKISNTKATMLEVATTDETTDDNDEEVSTTYTLTPRHSYAISTAPAEAVETTIVVTPPEISSNKTEAGTNENEHEAEKENEEEEEVEAVQIKNDAEDEGAYESASLKQNTDVNSVEVAQVAQAQVEAEDEDEDVDEEEEDAEEAVGSEIIEINDLQNENEKTDNSSRKQIKISENITIKPALSSIATLTDRTRVNTLTPLPLAVNEGVKSNSPLHAEEDTTPLTPTSVSSTNTPTLESPVRLREKRIPFEPDNNSTLTLVERLRYEASKYSGDGGDELVVNNKTRSLPPALQGDHESSSGVVNMGIGNSESTLTTTTNYGKIFNSSRRSLDSTSLPLQSHISECKTSQQATELQSNNSAIGSISSCSSSGTAAVTTLATAVSSGSSSSSSSSSCSTSSSTVNTMAERRPSWRLKFDAGCKFKLEDASSGSTFPPNNSTIIPSAPAVIAAANLSSTISQRRINSNSLNSSNQSLNSVGRPVSAPANTSTSTTPLSNDGQSESVGIFGRRVTSGVGNTYSNSSSATTATSTTATTTATVTASTAISASKANEDKDNDKENDNRNLAAQSAIQRRRKPKRRSTGVVHIDMDDLDPERHDSANDAEEKEKEKESGGERGASRSRLGSTTTGSSNSATDENKSRDKSENGEAIDYKALWEAVKLENDKLKQQLKKKDDEIVQSRATLERITNATTRNSLSELEKRERRAMERKLSEMEEELKLLQKLKTENERLRAENRALTRVVSKLTTSAQSQLAKKSK